MLLKYSLISFVASQAVSTNGFCGPNFGTVCPGTQCCGSFGLCGTGDQYCGQGCLVGFGSCSGTPSQSTSAPIPSVTQTGPPVSKDGTCGGSNGYMCPSSFCCSKAGYCGQDERYCNVANGCQQPFTPGKCSTAPLNGPKLSPDGTCGGEKGYTCSQGNCCSASGYCGSSAAFCSVASGCQQKFTLGTCSTAPPPSGGPSPDGTCGPNSVGKYKCSNGACCSQYGSCGTTDDFCLTAKGCQSAFGTCKSGSIPPGGPSPDGSCGPTSANQYKCSDGNCCSQYGSCGSTSDYCGVGCQSAFGICH